MSRLQDARSRSLKRLQLTVETRTAGRRREQNAMRKWRCCARQSGHRRRDVVSDGVSLEERRSSRPAMVAVRNKPAAASRQVAHGNRVLDSNRLAGSGVLRTDKHFADVYSSYRHASHCHDDPVDRSGRSDHRRHVPS